MSDSPKYSVVVPTYNSEEFLVQTVTTLSKALEHLPGGYEIVVVDDYSADDTWKKIEELKQQLPATLKGIRLSKNFGQHRATMCGFTKTKGDFIITVDDDLESNPDSIANLIDLQKKTNADLVYAHYTNLKRGFLRTILYSFFKWSVKTYEGKNRVNGSSFRLIKRSLALKTVNNANSFAFMDELFLWHTEKVEFCDVEHQVGLRGKSNYSISGLINSSTELILFSSDAPLRFIKRLGFTIACVNFILGIYYLIKKFLGMIGEPGYASLIISILFSTGLILLAIGIIGEYLTKLFRSAQNMPLYSIDEEI